MKKFALLAILAFSSAGIFAEDIDMPFQISMVKPEELVITDKGIQLITQENTYYFHALIFINGEYKLVW